MPEVERHPRQSIGGLWGVALFLSLPLRFQPQLQLHQAGVCAKATGRTPRRSRYYERLRNASSNIPTDIFRNDVQPDQVDANQNIAASNAKAAFAQSRTVLNSH
jgi:hypothetical protein